MTSDQDIMAVQGLRKRFGTTDVVNGQLVRGEEDRTALSGQRYDVFQKGLDSDGIKTLGWLVQNQKIGSTDDLNQTRLHFHSK